MSSDLSLQKVSRHFGETRAVDDVSLDIRSGQFVGVIGRSGAGKSTMLRLINRLVDPTEGAILYEGRDITALKGKALREWRRDCAMIFQQFNLVERLDVLTNVLIGRLAEHGFVSSMAMRFSDEERAMAIQALDRLDLVPQALQRAGTLSGGQQQRVAIAKALVQQPKIMLADEPIASLDPANATLVMDGLKTINREDGITVLVNLHTLDTARAYCDRIIAMRQGRVFFDGTAAQLTDDVVRDIYGLEGLREFNEAVTSTSVHSSVLA
ncbi:phosphonate transport system ATP-binding protein [Aliiroseovarius halocynthiae]|uniref:Phosphonate ABC transporter ATP-binding protein n=1 Tax=Aliiroseovarius halocynthiae TaxID=985055 RepID=A0A545SQV5_9RHOB|nr:phosphonate ABC transporter ATP-binding protein [Aliiroseovarius halocynthiae]TQV67370.1 phosphonate ABC transporter ATP-binding protein [Aliiroseovarius halocynthiae]SMR81279.1 phosphonate transport system ATP-binding protein [Aliiroseovarius halocynthiae]